MLSLIKSNNNILYSVAKPVTNIELEVAPYIIEMWELLKNKNGLGLAAPQVGLSLRFFIYKDKFNEIAINPIILKHGKDEEEDFEGCLSFPGQTIKVKRYKIIDVEYTNLGGYKVRKTLKGLSARIFQHELNHLNGICLFLEQNKINSK